MAEVSPNKLYHIMQTNLSNKSAHIPIRTIVSHVTDSPASIIATEAALQNTDLKTTGAMQFKPSKDKDTQMTCHKDMKARND